MPPDSNFKEIDLDALTTYGKLVVHVCMDVICLPLFQLRKRFIHPNVSHCIDVFLHIQTTVYHNWALHPSGEKALSAMLHPGAYARKSLTQSLTEGQLKCPVSECSVVVACVKNKILCLMQVCVF